jgi:uncharacterized protein (TIGR02598 family)
MTFIGGGLVHVRTMSLAESQPIQGGRRRGFSLAEVTLALAIVSFGLIAIMGLLPSGLQQVRESASEGVATNILSDLAAEISTLSTRSNSPRIVLEAGRTGSVYFDSDGRQIGTTTAPGAALVATWRVRGGDALKGVAPHVHLTVTPSTASPPAASLAETIIALDHEP